MRDSLLQCSYVSFGSTADITKCEQQTEVLRTAPSRRDPVSQEYGGTNTEEARGRHTMIGAPRPHCAARFTRPCGRRDRMRDSLLQCSYVFFGSEMSQTALAAGRESTTEQRVKFVPLNETAHAVERGGPRRGL